MKDIVEGLAAEIKDHFGIYVNVAPSYVMSIAKSKSKLIEHTTYAIYHDYFGIIIESQQATLSRIRPSAFRKSMSCEIPMAPGKMPCLVTAALQERDITVIDLNDPTSVEQILGLIGKILSEESPGCRAILSEKESP